MYISIYIQDLFLFILYNHYFCLLSILFTNHIFHTPAYLNIRRYPCNNSRANPPTTNRFNPAVTQNVRPLEFLKIAIRRQCRKSSVRVSPSHRFRKFSLLDFGFPYPDHCINFVRFGSFLFQ